MSTIIRLLPMPTETSYAPLGVLGYCLTRTAFLAPLGQSLDLPLKTVDYTPAAKLLDVLVSLLTGCRAVAQTNTRLRPDLALARAWGRERFAEQSTLARTLDAFAEPQVAQLRQGGEVLFRRESRVLQHNFAQDWLWLDIDLTPLPISQHAEASTKGKFAKKRLRTPVGPGGSATVSRDVVFAHLSRQTGQRLGLHADFDRLGTLFAAKPSAETTHHSAIRCRLRQRCQCQSRLGG